MALNQVIYLPNPAGTYTKTVGATVTAAGTSTLQTAIPASTYVRVRNFSITMTGTGATGGSLIGTLKIGAGQITCTLITYWSSKFYVKAYPTIPLLGDSNLAGRSL